MSDRVDELVEGIASGDRRALARAITLVESTRPDHRADGARLVDAVLGRTGGAIRIGVSGPPGVGKSTFIEALGHHVVEAGHRVAVLAVDPSSARSGGSVLGDKTRMGELGRRPEVFIRPSPGGDQLGGVARRTREALLLCEAAGFDVVLVETIGVGQSEVAVAELTDLFLLLVAPGGGDELQGIKRGVMELADLVVVNKADGDLAPAAARTQAEYAHALHLLRPRWQTWIVPVLACSSLTGDGVPEVWEAVESFRRTLTSTGELSTRRHEQAVAWLWSEIRDEVLADFRSHAAVQARLDELEREVRAGRRAPASAARELLDAFEGRAP